MNWFIIHNIESYNQHSDMIGCKIRNNRNRKPFFKAFNNIKKGDEIIYYSTGNYLIIGIFEVVSNIFYHEDDVWKKVMAYKIKPKTMPEKGMFLDFKKLYKTKDVYFDFIPKVSKWGVYLLGKICMPISHEDKNIIKNAFLDSKYLISKEKIKIKKNS